MTKLSPYQQSILKEFRESNKNILINAVPGSGKTFMLLLLLNEIRSNKSTIFLAFNKNIVEELKSKITRRDTEISTLHSLGCKSIYANYRGNVQVNDGKLYNIFMKNQDKFSFKKKTRFSKYINNLKQIIDMFKYNLYEDFNDEIVEHIVDYYNVDCIGDEFHDVFILFELYEAYNKNYKIYGEKFIIDFSDMIYLPVKHNYSLRKYDVVFLDECQDLNICQQELVKKLLKPTSRLIAAGDKNQCIFSFAGSDIFSYNKIKSIGNIVELPLSYTYRCGNEIVDLANKLYKVIEYSPFDKKAEVKELDEIDYSLFSANDFVLCRNNLPLIKLYFNLIRNKIVCCIYGLEIEAEITSLYKQVKANSIENIKKKCEAMLVTLYNKLSSEGIRRPLRHYKYTKLKENVEILYVILDNNDIKDVDKVIHKLFSDTDTKGVKLMTMHKSKGLETDTVFILNKFLVPSKYAKTDTELLSEKNLMYVAITRAKEKLYFIEI